MLFFSEDLIIILSYKVLKILLIILVVIVVFLLFIIFIYSLLKLYKERNMKPQVVAEKSKLALSLGLLMIILSNLSVYIIINNLSNLENIYFSLSVLSFIIISVNLQALLLIKNCLTLGMKYWKLQLFVALIISLLIVIIISGIYSIAYIYNFIIFLVGTDVLKIIEIVFFKEDITTLTLKNLLEIYINSFTLILLGRNVISVGLICGILINIPIVLGLVYVIEPLSNKLTIFNYINEINQYNFNYNYNNLPIIENKNVTNSPLLEKLVLYMKKICIGNELIKKGIENKVSPDDQMVTKLTDYQKINESKFIKRITDESVRKKKWRFFQEGGYVMQSHIMKQDLSTTAKINWDTVDLNKVGGKPKDTFNRLSLAIGMPNYLLLNILIGGPKDSVLDIGTKNSEILRFRPKSTVEIQLKDVPIPTGQGQLIERALAYVVNIDNLTEEERSHKNELNSMIYDIFNDPYFASATYVEKLDKIINVLYLWRSTYSDEKNLAGELKLLYIIVSELYLEFINLRYYEYYDLNTYNRLLRGLECLYNNRNPKISQSPITKGNTVEDLGHSFKDSMNIVSKVPNELVRNNGIKSSNISEKSSTQFSRWYYNKETTTWEQRSLHDYADTVINENNSNIGVQEKFVPASDVIAENIRQKAAKYDGTDAEDLDAKALEAKLEAKEQALSDLKPVSYADLVNSTPQDTLVRKSIFNYNVLNLGKYLAKVVLEESVNIEILIYKIKIEVPSSEILKKDFGYNSKEEYLKHYKKAYIEDVLDFLKNDTTVHEKVREAIKNGKIPKREIVEISKATPR